MSLKTGGCPYCQTFYKEATESYPAVTVKVVCKTEGIKTLELETSSKKGVPVITHIVVGLPYSIFQISVHFLASSLTYEMLR